MMQINGSNPETIYSREEDNYIPSPEQQQHMERQMYGLDKANTSEKYQHAINMVKQQI